MVVIMYTVSLVLACLAQKYYCEVQRLKDVIEFMVEEEIDEEVSD